MPESDEKLPSLENLQRRIDEAEANSVITDKGGPDTDGAPASSMAETAKLAWNMVSGAAVGILGGYFIDRWLGTSPIFIIVGFFLGFAAGLYGLIRKAGKDE